MARVVDAILRAQGYHTFVSPEGPDKGVDILAAPGPMGFGEPRLCVQVKSGDAPVDFATLNQLIGTMQNVHASQGLLVSWGGFKSTIDRETANMFFRVRLWDQDDLINALLEEYDKLDADFRTDLPLSGSGSLQPKRLSQANRAAALTAYIAARIGALSGIIVSHQRHRSGH